MAADQQSQGAGNPQGGDKSGGEKTQLPKDNLPKDNDPRQDARTEARRDTRRFDLAPFTVECGDHKASGLITIDHLKRRLRGRLEKSRCVGHGEILGRLPDIPGMMLEVRPREQLVIEIDPLEADNDLRERIENAQKNSEVTIRVLDGEKVKPWPRIEHKLDADQMKSILLEIYRKLDANCGDLHVTENNEKWTLICRKGQAPSIEDIRKQPGRELFDPWSQNPRRPKYADQREAYEAELERRHGEEVYA